MSRTELLISLEDVAPLFGDEIGDCFLLIASPDVRPYLQINTSNKPNCSLIEFIWLGQESRRDLIEEFCKLQQASLYCSALWIITDEYQHFTPAELKNIKIAAISLFSSPLSSKNLQHIWEITKNTNYQLQLKTESQIVDILDAARKIHFYCPEYSTQSVFEHQEAEYWFSLHGHWRLDSKLFYQLENCLFWTFSSGQFDAQSRFHLEGELLFQGMPVVHRSHEKISLSETLEQFERLAKMRDFPVIASVINGEIQHLHSPIKGYNPFLEELEQLFLKDGDYRKIHEIGFGTHVSCQQLVYDNFLPNERYPGVHFGLGLGGSTDFHLDLICNKIQVLAEMKVDGVVLNLYS